jgi:hypothetical protein
MTGNSLKLCRIFLKTASKPWGLMESSAKLTPSNKNRTALINLNLIL